MPYDKVTEMTKETIVVPTNGNCNRNLCIYHSISESRNI
jgi:hypothetical protein